MIATTELNPDAIKFVEDVAKWGTIFTVDDDLDLWKVASGIIMRDTTYIIDEQPSEREFYLLIGCCSHWLRPHQTRWTADGGFAWPSGYNGAGYSRTGLPQMDWCYGLKWHPEHRIWRTISQRDARLKRRFIIQAALPARTARHEQAAVNLTWQEGTPNEPRKKSNTFYGFRKVDGSWTLRAWSEER